jgi:hypothetical protein
MRTSQASILPKPSYLLVNHVCIVHVLIGDNLEFLMNHPVDELVGSAEEVGKFSCHPLLMPIIARPKDLQ